MRIDEGRRDQAAGRIDDAAGFGLDRRFDGGDGLAPDADVGDHPVGQRAALHYEVETHLSPFW
ncbi:hypothetical protein [Mesorhizobium marinum]|uniref:hypothetical protein n=1 Tax=Mesorhizobium marinum TaxID=3228790 RepID=UPI003F5B9EBB